MEVSIFTTPWYHLGACYRACSSHISLAVISNMIHIKVAMNEIIFKE